MTEKEGQDGSEGSRAQTFLDVLSSLMEEIPASEAEMEALIRASGCDPDAFADRMAAAAADALAASPLNWRNQDARLAQARAQLDRLAAPEPAAGPLFDRGATMAAIQRLMGRLGQRATPAYAHFRNFEVATDEDLASLLAELRYLADEADAPDPRDDQQEADTSET